jgi:hypothetical protein
MVLAVPKLNAVPMTMPMTSPIEQPVKQWTVALNARRFSELP